MGRPPASVGTAVLLTATVVGCAIELSGGWSEAWPSPRAAGEIDAENRTNAKAIPVSLIGHDSIVEGAGANACGWKNYRNIKQKQLIPQDA
jgi:hypothetical protein